MKEGAKGDDDGTSGVDVQRVYEILVEKVGETEMGWIDLRSEVGMGLHCRPGLLLV